MRIEKRELNEKLEGLIGKEYLKDEKNRIKLSVTLKIISKWFCCFYLLR